MTTDPIVILADARGTHRKDFLDRLVALSDGQVRVGLHFGDRDADFHAPSLNRLERRAGTRGYLTAGRRHAGANLDLLASPEFRQMMETAIDQWHRGAPAYQYRTHNIQNLQDYLDYYYILTDIMAEQMIENGITHALFFNIPHLGYDTLLYQVARSLGIKTIILCQTLFPSRYFSMQRIEDYGLFDPTGIDAPPFVIEKGSAPDLFYMDKRWQTRGASGKITRKAVGQALYHTMLREPWNLLNPVYLTRTLGRMARIYARFPDWRDPFSKYFHSNELPYFEHLAEYETEADIDLSAKFIYVPLHNQPEMSTSSLGGAFRDQLLMIEALNADLPPDWLIYVKENPRQGAFARGPMFFERLKRLPSVRMMPSFADTNTLAAQAQFVASVTGTAGWEAIRKGRPAMVFGAAWYRSLPGVHAYRPGLDFAQVAATQIDHATLEKAAGALLSRAHKGVIEQVYLAMADTHDPATNGQSVAETALGLLRGTTPLSFPPTD